MTEYSKRREPSIERAIGLAKDFRLKIDVDKHLASRKAVRDLLARQKVVVSSRRFAGGSMSSARVLVQGEYYDVNDNQLAQLRKGLSPAELMLEPARDED
jgi:hypothetical protein